MPTPADHIRRQLATVKYPGFNRDIVSFGLIKDIVMEGEKRDIARVKLVLTTRDPAIAQQIYVECRKVLEDVPGCREVKLDFDIKEPPQAAGGTGGSPMAGIGRASLPGVKEIIAIASGKGGVGKSTVASNLAVALAQTGARVGLCDCDLYGPSMAMMFGTDERPGATDENEIIPIEKHGVKLMSMGFLLNDTSPVIVRGPMATKYTQQFLRQVQWGELDYLVLDLPPGTGDIQLTIVQTVALSGAVIVTTPQEVALTDARKAATMFAKVNVPILGLVENMSYFKSPTDGAVFHLFGKGGGAKEAARLHVPLLAEIPIEMPVREAGDAGRPVALMPAAESDVSKVFRDLAVRLKKMLAAEE